MLKSNALEIIKSFTKQEIAEFKDFLQSPFFNKKSAIIKLFSEIEKFYPDYDNPNLEKETLWAKLYPAKEFNYGVMKNLIHELTKLAEEYVTQLEYRKNEVQAFSNLYKGISNRNLRNVFENKEKIFNKITGDDFIKNIQITIEEYYHLIAKMYENKIWNSHFYELKVNSETDRYLTEDNFITGMLAHLITIDYSTKTFSVDVKNKTNLNNPASLILNSIPDEVFNEVSKKIRLRSEVKYIILNLYYLMFKTANNLSEPKYFFKLKDFFYQNYNCLPALTIRDADVILLNTLSFIPDKNIDKGKEYFNIYMFKHNNNLILDKNKQINSLQFLPWSVIFLEENKSAELREFIHVYNQYLSDDQKQSTLYTTEAVYCLMTKEYEKALKLLSKTKFDLFPLKNFVKKVTLLVNYELNDYDTFLNNVDSHNHFLSYSEKEAKIERTTNVNRTRVLIKFLNRLFQIRESNKTEELKFLEREVNEEYIDFKKWFLRKIEELKSI